VSELKEKGIRIRRGGFGGREPPPIFHLEKEQVIKMIVCDGTVIMKE